MSKILETLRDMVRAEDAADAGSSPEDVPVVESETQPLSKASAKEKDDKKDDDDDGYDAKYMKKHMSRYMKDNPGEVSKCMRNLGDLNKAVGNLSSPKDAGEADAIMIDGTDFFGKFSEFADSVTEALTKAFGEIDGRLEKLESGLDHATELSEAVGAVLVKASESSDRGQKADAAGADSQPLPTRGTRAVPESSVAGGPEGDVLQKARSLGVSGIKKALLKAATDNEDRDFAERAGAALTQFECANGRLEMLQAPTLALINDITGGRNDA